MSEDELEKIVKSLTPNARRFRFRGKFLAFFFRVFLCKLANEAGRDRSKFFPDRKKVGFRPSDKNFLSELSQYAETPSCLRSFISALSSL